ncbi:MAG: glycosyltransferase family 4 protein, partial [Dehalococcoidia bacterium]|nr:glycosyltransferase family 4 protein [Dehalococcoidia bacterium]
MAGAQLHEGMPGSEDLLSARDRPEEAGWPRVLFLGSEYAGHRTRFRNLQETVQRDGRLRATFRSVTGWRAGGRVERLPLPTAVRGRLRGVAEAASLACLPRPDVTWTSASEVLTPFLWAQLGPLRRPLVLDLDATDGQLEAMAPEYYGRPEKRGMRRRLATAQEALLWRSTTIFTPWSNWAAEDLRRRGIADERIVVLPPGVDLDRWAVPCTARGQTERLRLLFVGGDFERKGGAVLAELVRGPLAGQFELDIVTHGDVEPGPNVRVHRAEPNSAALLSLFARADLFVLPTRAECFGIAAVEAMAAGLPVIMGNTGG